METCNKCITVIFQQKLLITEKWSSSQSITYTCIKLFIHGVRSLFKEVMDLVKMAAQSFGKTVNMCTRKAGRHACWISIQLAQFQLQLYYSAESVIVCITCIIYVYKKYSINIDIGTRISTGPEVLKLFFFSFFYDSAIRELRIRQKIIMKS